MKVDNIIIFLDIDGVMNHIGCKKETDFLQESIEVLNYLYKTYKAKIVISSSWREFYTMEYLSNLFAQKGCLCPLIDKTAEYIGTYKCNSFNLTEEEFNRNIGEMEGRNLEILHYVRIHGIEKYVILDDMEFTNKELLPHCILTSYFDKENGGLRKNHLDKIKQIIIL